MIVILALFMLAAVIPPQCTQAAYLGDRVLAYGSRGYDVQQLQKDLAYLGFNPGSIDGIFGPQTLAAVTRFQAHYGLNVDGVVGKQTAYAIIREVSKPVNTSVAPLQAASYTTPSRSLSITSRDIENLARLIHGEARGEPFEGKVAVAAVALNRLASQKFGRSLSEVIFQPGAFTAVSDGQFYLQPDASAYQAAQAALSGWDPTGGAIYYWNPVTATNKWVWSRQLIKTIGRHVFAI
ncbi:MAG: spore cortex-lytic enzyme [Syntrophomonadaceae bacterium]|jgi:N-acetylmuramoyl-L-alanine amidase